MRLLAPLVVGVLLACKASTTSGAAVQGTAADTSCARDSIRGSVLITGSEPATQIVLLRAGVPSDVRTLVGDRNVLTLMAGKEIVAIGDTLPGKRYSIREFVVRSSDNIPAADGRLIDRDGKLMLDTGVGAPRPIANPPIRLHDFVGMRVWLSGDLGGTIAAFGELGPWKPRACLRST